MKKLIPIDLDNYNLNLRKKLNDGGEKLLQWLLFLTLLSISKFLYYSVEGLNVLQKKLEGVVTLVDPRPLKKQAQEVAKVNDPLEPSGSDSEVLETSDPLKEGNSSEPTKVWLKPADLKNMCEC